jgi:hypothetical protein
MKKYITAILVILSISSYGQGKLNAVHYDKLTELKGTDYVLASVESWGKMLATTGVYLLFINTKTGESTQIDFPKDAYLAGIEQIKLDSLGINKVIVVARTVNLDGDKSIDWKDPMQLIVLSTDGKEKTKITEDKFFASIWAINRQTGAVVITGYYDSNNNNKLDKADKSEILVYDLKEMKIISKI